jgi:hypothetical protein
MKVALCGHTRAKIKDSIKSFRIPALSHQLQKPAIEPRPTWIRGEHFENVLSGHAIDLKVVMAAEYIVVNSADVWLRGINIHMRLRRAIADCRLVLHRLSIARIERFSFEERKTFDTKGKIRVLQVTAYDSLSKHIACYPRR